MASIPPYVATNTHVGQQVDVKVKKFIWLAVGQGSVQSFSNYEVNVTGRIKFLGYDGDLNIHLKLLDEAPPASRGPCCLQLNAYMDETAQYAATGELLTVFAVLGGKKQNISIRRVEKGSQTECKLFGHIDATVHLDPS